MFQCQHRREFDAETKFWVQDNFTAAREIGGQKTALIMSYSDFVALPLHSSILAKNLTEQMWHLLGLQECNVRTDIIASLESDVSRPFHERRSVSATEELVLKTVDSLIQDLRRRFLHMDDECFLTRQHKDKVDVTKLAYTIGGLAICYGYLKLATQRYNQDTLSAIFTRVMSMKEPLGLGNIGLAKFKQKYRNGPSEVVVEYVESALLHFKC